LFSLLFIQRKGKNKKKIKEEKEKKGIRIKEVLKWGTSSIFIEVYATGC